MCICKLCAYSVGNQIKGFLKKVAQIRELNMLCETRYFIPVPVHKILFGSPDSYQGTCLLPDSSAAVFLPLTEHAISLANKAAMPQVYQVNMLANIVAE